MRPGWNMQGRNFTRKILYRTITNVHMTGYQLRTPNHIPTYSHTHIHLVLALTMLVVSEASAGKTPRGLNDAELLTRVRECIAARLQLCAKKLDQTPDDHEWRFELLRAHHRNAAAGNGDSVRQAARLLATLAEEASEDQRITAYRGSLKLIEAKRAFWFWDKASLAKQGVKLLDRAVQLDPQDITVRAIRGISTSHLPDSFKRQDQSLADLAWAVDRIDDGLAKKRIDPAMATAILQQYGVSLFRSGQKTAAAEAWRRATVIGPKTVGGIKAAHMLRENIDEDGNEELSMPEAPAK